MAQNTRFSFANPSNNVGFLLADGFSNNKAEIISQPSMLGKPVLGLEADPGILKKPTPTTKRQPPSPNAKTAAMLQATDKGQTVISEKQKNGMIGAGVLIAVLFLLDMF